MEGLEFRPTVNPSRWRLILSGFLAALILGLALAGAAVLLLPRHLEYRVSEGELDVTSGLSLHPTHRRWPLAAVREVRPVELRGGRRLVGTALPGYCVGRFRYPATGAVWQATDCRGRGLLLRIDGEPRPVLLTPPDPGAFRRAVSDGGPYRHRFVFRGPPPSWWRGIQLFAALITGAAMWAAALFVLGARRLRYVVRPGELVVRTLFSSRRVPLAGLSARLDRGIRLWLRLWGIALPGYLAGLFKIPGSVASVYATSASGPFVVLEGGRRPLLLTPAEPEAFLEALRSFGVPTTPAVSEGP